MKRKKPHHTGKKGPGAAGASGANRTISSDRTSSSSRIPATDPGLRTSGVVDLTLIACLSRLCQMLSQIIRDVGKDAGLSPEQIRFLLYLRNATPSVATVMDLSRTFLLGHSTVSESVTSLLRLGLVRRVPVGPGRKARLELTRSGRAVSERVAAYSLPVREALDTLEASEKIQWLRIMLKIIRGFQEHELLPPTRICSNCVYFHPNQFAQSEEPHHCDDYGVALATGALRLECPEYREAPRPIREANWEAVIRNDPC